jgi:hypothetical protein
MLTRPGVHKLFTNQLLTFHIFCDIIYTERKKGVDKMKHDKVVPIVMDILESCDCEDEKICDKCIFVDICMGIFTGDFGRLAFTVEEK